MNRQRAKERAATRMSWVRLSTLAAAYIAPARPPSPARYGAGTGYTRPTVFSLSRWERAGVRADIRMTPARGYARAAVELTPSLYGLKGHAMVAHCGKAATKARVFVPGSLRAERALECVQLAAAFLEAACRRSCDLARRHRSWRFAGLVALPATHATTRRVSPQNRQQAGFDRAAASRRTPRRLRRGRMHFRPKSLSDHGFTRAANSVP